jgi:hypothetical protein
MIDHNETKSQPITSKREAQFTRTLVVGISINMNVFSMIY